ncbi:hypothetical protein ACKLNO_06125 [Neisseriaceae bacterium B1]
MSTYNLSEFCQSFRQPESYTTLKHKKSDTKTRPTFVLIFSGSLKIKAA